MTTDTRPVLTLLVVALLFGVINEFVRPIVSFLSIPLYILTLGLFFFVVNALMLLLHELALATSSASTSTSTASGRRSGAAS